MTPDDARALVGQQLGAYHLEALLPIGGLPECFVAYHVQQGRQVAVKLLPGTLAGGRETLSTLREEARRVSALKHPNILPIHGVAESQGILYAVTPIPAQSLRDQLDRDGVLPATYAVQLAAQLAWALHALHGIGYIHGDVQPGTLLFDDVGTLQLADFGAARALARQRGRRSRVASRTWPLAGARSYIAPEVVQAGEISVRADIYALGAVLYEMLIGNLPRQQATLGEPELVTAPLPPSLRSSDTWPELAAVALKALERDPAKRYADARAFAIALRRAVMAEPELPREPSLRDALAGVWHPEAEDHPGIGEVATFKKKLATMPPAPSPAAMRPEPTLREKLATAPPAPSTPSAPPAQQSRPHVPSAPYTPPAARQVPQPPTAGAVPSRHDGNDERHEDFIATTLLPDRSAPKPDPAHEDFIATTLLPDRPLQRPQQPAAPLPTEPPRPSVYDAPQAARPQPGWQSSRPSKPSWPSQPSQSSAHPPVRFPPASGSFYTATKPPHMDPPAPTLDDDGYIAPDELARTLAGRRPGPARRITAALAGMVLLVAFGAGTAGILTGFGGRATPILPSSSQPAATATSGATSTSAPAPTRAAGAATPHNNTTPLPTATPQPAPKPTLTTTP